MVNVQGQNVHKAAYLTWFSFQGFLLEDVRYHPIKKYSPKPLKDLGDQMNQTGYL